MLEDLAATYAKLKGTTVVASRVEGDTIIIVLESGPKLTMTEAELMEQIQLAQPEEPFEYIEQAVEQESGPKPKRKRGH